MNTVRISRLKERLLTSFNCCLWLAWKYVLKFEHLMKCCSNHFYLAFLRSIIHLIQYNFYAYFLYWPVVSLLILFILFRKKILFKYMTIFYALLVLLVTMLVTPITSLFDLTVSIFTIKCINQDIVLCDIVNSMNRLYRSLNDSGSIDQRCQN